MVLPGRHEVRTRAVVLTLALLLLGTVALVLVRDREHGPGDTGALLSLTEETPGLRAVDVALDAEATRGEEGLLRRQAGGLRTRQRETAPFEMIGFSWERGETAAIRYRVHREGGWRAWQEAEVQADQPDGAEAASARQGTELTWVGTSDGVEVEVEGRAPADLTMTLMDGESEPAAQQTLARARPYANPLRPKTFTRKDWGADERLRSSRPTLDRTVRQVHVHHTVNSNAYARDDVPGLIRGMYRYHTQNLGWSDIGYNFLVDRFGRMWNGRYGGGLEPVRGAHTLGFNNDSVGISAIGNFETARPTNKMVNAIAKIAAWRLEQYGRNPRGRIAVTSTGSDKYGAGRTVRLPVIDGHRDTNDTACPGTYLYAKLPLIRERTERRINRFANY